MITNNIIILMPVIIALALQSGTVDFLGSIGKLYSVVAVIVIIFLGIILFLWRIDKRVDKIENHINNGK